MKVHVYGIIDSNDRLDESLRGLNGASVYNIPFRDIGMAATNIDECVKDITGAFSTGHDDAVKGLMKSFTVLPLRFSTPVNREDVVSMLEGHYNEFRENLDRLRNKGEFGIKVVWSGKEIKEQIIRNHAKDNYRMPEETDSQGKRFIEDVFEKYIIEKEFREKADICASIMDNFLNRFAHERKLEKLKNNDLLLNAFYLVKKERQRDFQEAFAILKMAPGEFNYMLSGPLPPYNFVRIEI